MVVRVTIVCFILHSGLTRRAAHYHVLGRDHPQGFNVQRSDANQYNTYSQYL